MKRLKGYFFYVKVSFDLGYSKKENNVPNEFTLYFKEIFEDLDLLKWVFYFESFRVPMLSDNWEDILNLFETDLQKNSMDSGYFYYDSDNLIQKYYTYVSDDWNCLYGFARNVDFKEIKKIDFTQQHSKNQNLVELVNTILYNYDNLYWLIFTKDHQLFNKVLNINKSNSFIRINELTYFDYFYNLDNQK